MKKEIVRMIHIGTLMSFIILKLFNIFLKYFSCNRKEHYGGKLLSTVGKVNNIFCLKDTLHFYKWLYLNVWESLRKTLSPPTFIRLSLFWLNVWDLTTRITMTTFQRLNSVSSLKILVFNITLRQINFYITVLRYNLFK